MTRTELGVEYTEINLDAHPSRRAEAKELSGRSTVPQIFVNGRHVGGNDDLQALHADGGFLPMLEELQDEDSSAEAPARPDDTGVEVHSLEVQARSSCCTLASDVAERLGALSDPDTGVAVKDRRYRLSSYAKCFVGSEAVTWMLANFDDVHSREDAVAVGQQLLAARTFHHVCDEHEFKDDKLFYRFQRDEAHTVLNIAVLPADCERRPAVQVGEDVRRSINALYNAHLAPDGSWVDYKAIGASPAFATYKTLACELQTIDLGQLTRNETLALFINIYNALVIHAHVSVGPPTSSWQRWKFFTSYRYLIGGHEFSLNDIENGVLRGNKRPPFSFSAQFGRKDARQAFALNPGDARIHFALVCGAKSCPPIKLFQPDSVQETLELAAAAFLESELVVDVEQRRVEASQILNWYLGDFVPSDGAKGEFKYHQMLLFAREHAQGALREQLDSLLESTAKVAVSFRTYDWTVNAKPDDA